MNMRKYSTLLNKWYDDDGQLVYVTNFVQCSKFLNNGAVEDLCDILYSGTKRPDTLVFVFKKTPLIKELYRKWQNHELN
jgi:hypothetical protein